MNYPKYDLKASTDFTIFEFMSSGIHGDIYKVIKYTVTQNPDIVNLGFGDKINIRDNNKTFDIDDLNITNNGDRNIILATIASTIYTFTTIYPNKYIFFSGSCKIRTRLYRIAISTNYKELVQTFHIFGILQNPDTGKYYDIPFNRRINFIGFLIKRK